MIKFCNFHIINTYKPSDYNDGYGNKFWFDGNGDCHRDFDLPALISRSIIKNYSSTTKCYMNNNKLHRVNPKTGELDNDYPAVIWYNGDKEYYKNDIRYIYKNNRFETSKLLAGMKPKK